MSRLLRPDLADLPAYKRPPEPPLGARLHLNEAARDWPQAAREALLARLATIPFHRYPERQSEVTERLTKRLGAPAGGVLLGPSSGALIDLVANGGLSPGEEVAVPDPGFGLYALLVRRHGGRIRKVPIGDGFPIEPWFDALDCRQLWLTLPNNPTGAWAAPDAVEPLLQAAAARANPPLVLIDEAYAEFAPKTFRLVVDRYENVLIARTFAKALGSAGWRLGALIGPPPLIEKLAALQLPYSLGAAQLEALDVALDYAGEFHQLVNEVVERRERLARAMPKLTVVPSAANFLFVRPDPSAELQQRGILVRAYPGTNTARIALGSEDEARRVAEAMGGALPPAQPRAPRHLLVLDVDGVLVDATESFRRAVSQALAKLRPELPWKDDFFHAFKRVGGFNNDFRLTAGALALHEVDGLHRLDGAAGKGGFPELDARIAELEPDAKIAVQAAYAQTRKLEQPLILLHELQGARGVSEVAVLTGRPPEELALAWEVLGFTLPAVCDAGPHLRKPEPAGLLQLADAFRADVVTFVGDTRDDAECLRRARALRPELTWRFGAVGPDRGTFASQGDLVAADLRTLLGMLEGTR